MKVVKVRTNKQMRAFVRIPKILFGDHPCYVPPIWMEEKRAYSGKTNPILKNSDFELFLLVDEDNQPIGRTIAYVDFNHNKFYKTKMGFFGAFECIDNQEAGKLLMDVAETWIKKQGMNIIRGPIHPVAENWGFVFEGYESPPMFMSPWNPPYYHDFFTDTGYEKSKDLLVYEIDLLKGYTLPERYETFYDSFMKRNSTIKIRRINMKNIKKDAYAIWEITNIALKDNWGYVPLELSVMEDMLRKLKLIVDPDAVWIVEDDGKAVGYCLGFPDINVILKKIRGKVLPFGWTKLLFGVKKLRDYRLYGLAALPEYQGKALDALMYINLYRHLVKKNVRMEANYILEDNFRIRNALEKLGMYYTKTYRIYDKSLIVDEMHV
ncbi:MAG: hypothetical protein KAQ68_00455 [Clostridiales bacterium]|nr:hypothetical protein [Clostridiales bacterium]